MVSEAFRVIHIHCNLSDITKCQTEKNYIYTFQWHTEGVGGWVGGGEVGGFGVFKPPRSFDKAAFDCKLSRKCLVFLFQHPN